MNITILSNCNGMDLLLDSVLAWLLQVQDSSRHKQHWLVWVIPYLASIASETRDEPVHNFSPLT